MRAHDSSRVVFAIAVIVAVSAGAASARRQTAPRSRMADAIDALVASVYGPGQPGAAVLVQVGGDPVLRKGYGLANAELDVAMAPDSVMPIGSLSKALTAAGILALAEQGRLSLQDDITKFLPDYPAHDTPITIEHLLTHTSGISSLTETSDLRAAAVQDVRVVDLLADWVRDLPPDAQPGVRWAYSNWGYHLLAAVIEQASGRRYEDVIRTTILEPLGMRRTFYLDRRRVIPSRASGYEVLPDGLFNVLPPRARAPQPNGAGGWLSTVDDLARWSAGLDAARVLSRASIDRMFTPYRLKDGSSTRYGYGWDLGEYAGHRIEEHQGGTSGFLAHIVRVPDERVLVVILSNRSSTDVPLPATAHRVAALALGQPIPEPAPVPMPRDVLENLAGTYRGRDIGTCTIALDGGALTAAVPGLGALPLVPVGSATFRSPVVTWTFTFETDSGGRGLRVRVRDWKLNDVAERFTPPAAVMRPKVAMPERDLDACAGEYESLNGILVKVERVGDHLSVHPFAQPALEVFPAGPLTFSSGDGLVEYRFVKTASGGITRFERTTVGAPVPARRLR